MFEKDLAHNCPDIINEKLIKAPNNIDKMQLKINSIDMPADKKSKIFLLLKICSKIPVK